MLTRRDFIISMLAGGLAVNLPDLDLGVGMAWNSFAGVCPPSVDRPDIRVLGVGSVGTGAVKQLIQTELKEVPYYHTLNHRFFVGRDAIEKSSNGHDSSSLTITQAKGIFPRIEQDLKGCDLVFLITGVEDYETFMTPEMVQTLMRLGPLIIAVVPTPFNLNKNGNGEFVGKGIQDVRNATDSIILVPPSTARRGLVPDQAGALSLTVKSLIESTGLNQFMALDFRDFRDLFARNLVALAGSGTGFREQGILLATQKALSNLSDHHSHFSGPQNVFVHYSPGLNSFPVSMFEDIKKSRKIIGEGLGEVILDVGSTDRTLGATTRVTVLTFDVIE